VDVKNGNYLQYEGSVYPTVAGGAFAMTFVNKGYTDVQCSIRLECLTGSESTLQFWNDANGNYSGGMAFRTTVSGTPGIYVNGDVSALSVTDRTLLADPEMAEFVYGEGEERGVDLGQVVKYLMARIKVLEAKVAKCCGE
jgi:hypothetical protein